MCVCSRARVICGDCLSLSASVCVLITSSSTKFLPSLCVNPISSPQTVRLMAIGAVSSRRSLLANLFPFPFSLVLSCTIYLSQPFGPGCSNQLLSLPYRDSWSLPIFPSLTFTLAHSGYGKSNIALRQCCFYAFELDRQKRCLYWQRYDRQNGQIVAPIAKGTTAKTVKSLLLLPKVRKTVRTFGNRSNIVDNFFSMSFLGSTNSSKQCSSNAPNCLYYQGKTLTLSNVALPTASYRHQ